MDELCGVLVVFGPKRQIQSVTVPCVMQPAFDHLASDDLPMKSPDS